MRGIRIFKWTFLILGLTFIAFTILVLVNDTHLIARADTGAGHSSSDMLSDRDALYAACVRFRIGQGKGNHFRGSRKGKASALCRRGPRAGAVPVAESAQRAHRQLQFAVGTADDRRHSRRGLRRCGRAAYFCTGCFGKRKKEHLLAYGNAIETEFQGVERNGALEFNGKNPWRISFAVGQSCNQQAACLLQRKSPRSIRRDSSRRNN